MYTGISSLMVAKACKQKIGSPKSWKCSTKHSNRGFFSTSSVNVENNSKWFGGGDDNKIKNKLHKGDCSDLNVYTLSPAGGILGFSFYPDHCKIIKKGYGVVILHKSMPGGSYNPYNLGDTLTHEVEQWLGFYHTFQDFCGGRGDWVSETPKEAEAEFGCPT